MEMFHLTEDCMRRHVECPFPGLRGKNSDGLLSSENLKREKVKTASARRYHTESFGCAPNKCLTNILCCVDPFDDADPVGP